MSRNVDIATVIFKCTVTHYSPRIVAKIGWRANFLKHIFPNDDDLVETLVIELCILAVSVIEMLPNPDDFFSCLITMDECWVYH